MAARIYVGQRAVLHADTELELDALRDVATEAIVKNGGAIEEFDEVRKNEDGTVVQQVFYLALRAGL